MSFKHLHDQYCTDTQGLIYDWIIKDNQSLLFEGAQGTLLDIDHGTYPYVTSSSTTAGGVSTGLGLGPKYINKIIGRKPGPHINGEQSSKKAEPKFHK